MFSSHNSLKRIGGGAFAKLMPYIMQLDLREDDDIKQ
jgi:hypothetical protein